MGALDGLPQLSGYRRLIAWQKGLDLVDGIYDAVRWLPLDERFELSSQMRRAAVSVPANIAEGYCRTPRAYHNHLDIAQGSTGELDTLVCVAVRRHFFSEALAVPLLDRILEQRKILNGLRASVERRYRLSPP